MNIYENNATQAIVSIFKNEALWKKELLFNFLLEPFELTFEDIVDVTCQDSMKDTIPDFTITTRDKKLKFEVKISNVGLTESETKTESRDCFLVPENYFYWDDIPLEEKFILTWEDLFKFIDKKGATENFDKLALTREYLTSDSEDEYFKKDIDFLSSKLINNESLRSIYRETFIEFLKCVKQDNDSLTIRDDTYYSDSSVYAYVCSNEDSDEFVSIEYAYLDYEEDLTFYCHHSGSNIDKWDELDIDFSNCENLISRIYYLIENVLKQYKRILGDAKYKIFFKTENSAIKILNSRICELSETDHASSEFGNKIIENWIKPIAEKISAKYKLEMDDFCMSSNADSGFYMYKKSWDNFRIGFEFETRGYRDLFFGIQVRNGPKSEIKKSTRNKLNSLKIEKSRKSNDWWPKREYCSEYRNWDINTFQELLTNKNKFEKLFDAGVKKYFEACKNIK